ncbi:hypothetical protein CROQUDRAFT_44204 [Cronartium quercuum f. sp. fusiforme G11]|uniref:Uncharacterized protein n=1 Tax=Cronartium quercuum f. sp. fusiforme G11 TaxID=708437 RepID=A0A9P6NM58_9BASI|nr:hypothetical protein CROQUDRAFT_44204 [Cronartium quercuum f. sp. fusiforme G11]
MPPCVKQPGYDPLPWGIKPDEDLNIDIQASKYPGWIPSCCSKKYFICVFVKPGVTLSPWKPGAGRILYRFELGNGTHVDLFWYWQGTIQYTATGGTVDFYPAHGNTFICVKGGMHVRTLQKGKPMLNIPGIPGSSEEFNCECEWAADRTSSSDDDLILYPK